MNYYLVLAIILFFYMNIWFIVSLIKKRNDIADVAWGIGFVLLSWSSFFMSGNLSLKGIVVVFLVSIWGLRLALHIYYRNRDKTEDYRYLAWRQEWGKWFYIRSYFQVYILQGFLLFIIVTPVLIINKNTVSEIGNIELLGILIWVIGFCFEAIGDAQLAKFVKDPSNKGKIMQSGLWSYTRHPNYFGEVTQWWGIWLISLSAQYGFWGIVGPITITFLILRVSGIPMLEKKMSDNPEFLEYKKKTSSFFPIPPILLSKFYKK